MIVPILAILIALAFFARLAFKGLKGEVRLPFRGGGGGMTLTGRYARVTGAVAALMCLLLAANLILLLWLP